MKKKLFLDLPLGMILLGAGFFLGGLLGFFFAGLVAGEGEVGLSAYFLAYLQAVEEGNGRGQLATVVWGNLKFPLLAFFMGFSFLGTVGLPLLFGVEGFIFTFSISTLCRVLGVSGLIPAFLLFGLPALLWSPLLFLLGLQSFHSAMQLWGRGRSDLAFPRGYFFRSALCFLGMFLCIAYEFLCLPGLLRGVL